MLPNTPTASLLRGKTTYNDCLANDTKQSDGKASVMLEFWRMWYTASLLLLPGPLWTVVIAPDRVLFIGQIELNRVLTLK